MVRRIAVMVLAAASIGWVGQAQAQIDVHPAVDRPEIKDVGEPILINRKVLAMEMRRNSELREWVRLYGAPDYAEVQEIEIEEPFAPYEVRLYYLKGNAYLAFGRVHVAPSLYDYGVRKYMGPVDPAEVDRLLTAKPAVDEANVSMASAGPALEAPNVEVVTTAVEGKPVSN
jgi:hypothetical protein